jgi:hypothetical protein
MLDVHPPHNPTHTWRDFFIHIATICVGLLIAIGLEQTVEAIHHHHQRRQLDEDLIAEAESNRQVITRDLRMLDVEPWFLQAEAAVASATPQTGNQAGKLHFTLPPPPCIPGSVGTAAVRYFAPSEAVWTAARESGLIVLLPAEQARMQARLAHNYVLLAASRDKVHDGCQAIVALHQRFAQPTASANTDLWTLTPEQAEHLASSAADTRVAIQALLFRLRWSDIYEQGIANGESKADIHMMTIDQTRFEDPEIK